MFVLLLLLHWAGAGHSSPVQYNNNNNTNIFFFPHFVFQIQARWFVMCVCECVYVCYALLMQMTLIHLIKVICGSQMMMRTWTRALKLSLVKTVRKVSKWNLPGEARKIENSLIPLHLNRLKTLGQLGDVKVPKMMTCKLRSWRVIVKHEIKYET